MRILTDVSKAELDYLTSQPTAKAMIEKVKTEGKYIAEGDAQGAAAFVASRKQQRQQIEAELNQVNAELLLKTTESYRREHSSVY